MPQLVPELSVTDIKTSLDFYQDILGFSIKYERPDEGFAYLTRQGAEIMLDQIGKTRDWATAPLTPPFGRGVNLQIQTSDIADLYAHIHLKNAEKIFLNLEDKWYDVKDSLRGNRQFIVSDLDGYLLRFFEDLGHKNDA